MLSRQYKNIEEILQKINNDITLNKDNLIYKIKSELEEQDQDVYKKWQQGNFNLNHPFKLEFADTTLSQRMTLLHVAAKGRYVKIVKYLLENGVKVNVYDTSGITPLHHAAHTGNESQEIESIKEILSSLLKSGANPLLESIGSVDDICGLRSGCTPRFIAHNSEIGKFLEAAEKQSSYANVKNIDGNIQCIYPNIQSNYANTLFLSALFKKEEKANDTVNFIDKDYFSQVLQSGWMKLLFISKEKAQEIAQKDNKDIIKEIKQRQAVALGLIVGTVATLVTAGIIFWCMSSAGFSVLATAGIVLGSGLAAGSTLGGITFMMSKPNTKVEEQNVEQHASVKPQTV
jgi:hypothetical protein